ncbi:hypothetical protein BTHI11S_00529 [Bosea thiooxidans]
MAVEDEVGALALQHGLEGGGVDQLAAALGAADIGRVVDQHDADEAFVAGAVEQRLDPAHLLAADAARGHQRQGRHAAVDADQRHRPAAAIPGIAGAALVPGDPGGEQSGQGFQRGAGIGIVIARHEADRVARPERVQEGDGGLELVRQADMGDIAGAGDMVRPLRMDIGDDARQDLHVMGVPALAAPVDIAGRTLAEELMQREPGERAEMRVGQMRELEHAPALALARGQPSSAPMARLGSGCVQELSWQRRSARTRYANWSA